MYDTDVRRKCVTAQSIPVNCVFFFADELLPAVIKLKSSDLSPGSYLNCFVAIFRFSATVPAQVFEVEAVGTPFSCNFS